MPAQIQRMSAVWGITHAVFYPSRNEPLQFPQIWFCMRKRALTPSHRKCHPRPAHAADAEVLVISPGQTVTPQPRPGWGAWLQIAEGALTFNDV